MEENTTPQAAQGSGNTIAMWCHLSALAMFIIPFGNIIGPLVVWLTNRDKYPVVNDQGREALNFQISMLLYSLIGLVLVFILIGGLILVGLLIFNIVQIILAALSANKGNSYRYPICLRLIK